MISKCIRRLSFRSLATDDTMEKTCRSAADIPCYPAPLAVKPSWTTPSSVSRTSADTAQSAHMHCTVYLQQSTDTSMISIVLHRAERPVSRPPHGDVVASSAVSANIQYGSLSLELQSRGQHLRATESVWVGGDVEKQFVLHSEQAESSGVLGKVMVRHTGQATTLFELFALLPRPVHTLPPADMAWGAVGFREIADLLELVDEDSDVIQLAKDLGFTERELSTAGSGDDLFCALLSTYASRGGTPQELLRAMYNCRRGRGLGTVGGSPPSPRRRLLSQCSSSLSSFPDLDPALDDLEEAALLSPMSSPIQAKRKRSHASSTSTRKRSRISEETADYDLDFCDAATLPVGDLDCGIDQTALPPTPPATPLKRVSATSGHVFN